MRLPTHIHEKRSQHLKSSAVQRKTLRDFLARVRASGFRLQAFDNGEYEYLHGNSNIRLRVWSGGYDLRAGKEEQWLRSFDYTALWANLAAQLVRLGIEVRT